MSGVYNSKYTGEQIDAMLHDKEVQNISDVSTIYSSPSALPTLTAADNGKRYLAQMEPDKPYKIGAYHWMSDTQTWEFLFQLTGSTIYLDHATRLAYQYRSSAPYLRPLIPNTATYKVSNSQGTPFHLKIHNFGDWGSSANYANVSISMLLTSRANEVIFLNISSNDGYMSVSARKLSGTYSKIAGIYYNVIATNANNDVLENALYVTMEGYSNVLCVQMLSSSHQLRTPTIELVSALPATKTDGTGLQTVSVINVGAGTPGGSVYFGNVHTDMTLYGSADRPKYSHVKDGQLVDSRIALIEDIENAIGGALAAANVCYVSDAVPAASVGKDGDICIVSG